MLGVWMWPRSIRVNGAEKTVCYCRRCGVTDIFFLTKGLGGTVSCRSSLAPSDCERDLLQELLDAAHGAGLRVHAWFTSASDAHYKSLHPESGRYHFEKGRDGGLISLADEGYMAYMEAVVRELCRTYDVDGVHLDYIRYNHLIYGWSEEDLARYAAEGADTAYLREMMARMFVGEEKEPELLFDAYRAGNSSALALARARRRDVVRFATRLIRAAREEKPSLAVTAALMPEGAYEDLAFSDLHYGQNYEDAAALYDYVLPMAYSLAYEKDAPWVRSVTEGTLRRGLRCLTGVHAYEGGTGATLQADLAAVKDSGAMGACLFREGAFVMAFATEDALTLFNPTEEAVTALSADGVQLPVDLPAGGEARLSLPCRPASLQAFSGDRELCVLLVQE